MAAEAPAVACSPSAACLEGVATLPTADEGAPHPHDFAVASVCSQAASAAMVPGIPTTASDARPAQPHHAAPPTMIDSPFGDPLAAVGLIADSLGTQSTHARGLKGAMQNMMHPEHMTQGDTQTQSVAYRPSDVRSESTEWHGPSTVSPTKSSMAIGVPDERPLLSQTKALRLKQDEAKLRKQALGLVRHAGRKIGKGDIVLCQCGHAEEEDGMVQCTYCQTWQHLPCYGFTATDDPRLPDEHTCYRCLLGDDENHTLIKLQDLAVKRRAMDFANQNGLTTPKNLADVLQLELAAAKYVYGYLKTSGFVVPAAGAHIAGYAATGRPSLVPVPKGPKHEWMLQTLFDPLMHISHHYQIPPKPLHRLASLTQRLLASQARDMPPPATPAANLRKRKATTPASGLDLRLSEPVETPSRVRGSGLAQGQSFKTRACSPRPAKRVASPRSMFTRLRSVRSRFVIDANGCSSPVQVDE
ncbi:hypothetical protein LTR53_016798 [Teratosphaeriaceae sp. CCFEE 6253]|nr:hypothetical protein LTR53_016798 [Teratosphaeriaceae sp. CCFEE 6253]